MRNRLYYKIEESEVWEFIPKEKHARTSSPVEIRKPVSIDWNRSSEMGGLFEVSIKLHSQLGDAELASGGYMVLIRAFLDVVNEIERRGYEQEFAAIWRTSIPIPTSHALVCASPVLH